MNIHRVLNHSLKLGLTVTLSAWAALSPLTSQAQDAYPTKTIRFVVPYPPGGPTDMMARMLQGELQTRLGVAVMIDNKSGAGGNLGSADVAKQAPADGHTLLLAASGPMAVNPTLYRSMPFNPLTDLAPVIQISSFPLVLEVHPSLGIKSVKELIAQSKNPKSSLSFASAGNGTPQHLAGELFNAQLDTHLTHIPYKGSAPAMNDLLGGQVMMMFDNIPSAMPHIKAGKLKALATTGAKRDPSLPDLPTVAEAGLSGYESGVWFGLMVPANTPREIVNKLNAEAVKGTKSPDYIKRMSELGYIIHGTSPEVMAEWNKAEVQRWGPIVKSSGAKAD